MRTTKAVVLLACVAVTASLLLEILPMAVASASPIAPAATSSRFTSPNLPGEVPGLTIVKTAATETPRSLGGKVGVAAADISKGENNTARVRTPAGKTDEAFRSELEANPAVLYASPVYFRKVAAYSVPPNDPHYTSSASIDYWDGPYPFARSWWLRTRGLNAPALWRLASASSGGAEAGPASFPVAVIDTGFYLSHPDRGSNIKPKRDEFQSYDESTGVLTQDLDVTPVDPSRAGGGEGESSHGTLVAGQIGAATNNGQGVAGAAYEPEVWIYKVQGLYYSSTYPDGVAAIFDLAVVDAIYDATDDGAKVINISLVGDQYSPAMQDAIDYAYSRGVLVVAATGNDGESNGVDYPAANNHVVGVGAYGMANGSRAVAPFTNSGAGGDPVDAGDNNGKLDVLGPGVLVWGMVDPAWDEDGAGDMALPGYTFADGTSMASPAVAGIAAALWRFAPALNPDQLSYCLTATSGELGSSGYGSTPFLNTLDAYARLQMMKSDGLPPSAPIVSVLASTDALRFSWTKPHDYSGIAGYTLYNGDGTWLADVKNTVFTYTFEGLAPGTTRSLFVTATDLCGNTSAPSNTASATTKVVVSPPPPDTTAPAPPTNLSLFSTSPTTIDLSWDDSFDAGGINEYRVYTSTGVFVTNTSITTVRVSGLSAGTTCSYCVTAEDDSGNVSAPSEIVTGQTLQTPDTVPPTVPQGVTFVPDVQSIHASWEPSTDDRTGVSYYRVKSIEWFDYGPIAWYPVGDGETSCDVAIPPATGMSFKVVVYDGAGNSAESAWTYVQTLDDVTPPPPPTFLQGRGGTTSGSLWWTSTDDVGGIDRYTVYTAGGAKVGENNRKNSSEPYTNFVVPGLLPGTTSAFYVTASNHSGAESAPSPLAYIATEDAVPVPTPPVVVYRFFNARLGTHFYTADVAERDHVIAALSGTFAFEGAAYSVNPASNVTQLHRFYNMRTGTHFYTASESEKASVIAGLSDVFRYEGPSYNVSAGFTEGATTVWRFYNVRNGTHFYTANAAEKAGVEANLGSIYHLDGPAFYLAP